MAKKETAEQKLLKIIEASQGPLAATAAPAPAAPTAPAAGQQTAREIAHAVKNSGVPSLSNLLSPLSGLLKGIFPASPGTFAFGPREINKILFLGVAVAVCAFTINLFSGARLLKQKVVFELDTKTVSSEGRFFPSVVAITGYLADIQKRNIFQPYEKKETAEGGETAPQSALTRIATMTKNFKLVGISWLDSPESASAMIEDSRTGITHFLKVGEQINNVVIKNIYQDRVVLGFENEEVTIRL